MQSSVSPRRSLRTFIAIIILVYVCLALKSSISLHHKIVVHQKTDSMLDDHPPSMTGYYEPDPSTSTAPPPPPHYDVQPNKKPSLNSPIIAPKCNLSKVFKITWGEWHAEFLNGGEILTLALDRFSGSGFQSKKAYLFGKIDMQIKLISNNSAGTVTTYYLSSEGEAHDEIDFEFLGNVTGQPYTLHTNVYGRGEGNREKQFYLWFDPTADFHTYSILWNPKRIIFSVDGTPIREFKNMESIGVPFPKNQPMRVYSSLWNADDWATQGGRVKTDWRNAPFVASYRNFSAKACVWADGSSSCGSQEDEWLTEELDSEGLKRMKWVEDNYMTYNYCQDKYRFPQGLPKECRVTAS